MQPGKGSMISTGVFIWSISSLKVYLAINQLIMSTDFGYGQPGCPNHSCPQLIFCEGCMVAVVSGGYLILVDEGR